MRTPRLPSISPSEITDEPVYRDRRHLLAAFASAPLLGTLPGCAEAEPPPAPKATISAADASAGFRTSEEATRYEDITTYNNFYEFGTDKGDPSRAAKTLRTSPWTVAVEGECAGPAASAWKTWCADWRRRSASTGCAAWKAGRW
jgi:methionine sulfoxide reductase catalytic subunit